MALFEYLLVATCCLGLVQVAVAKDDDDCKSLERLVFEPNQDIILPQDTLIKLAWLKNNCFKRETRKQRELISYINLSFMDSTRCESNEIHRLARFDDEMKRTIPGTNAADYVLAYNQLFYRFCLREIDTLLNEYASKRFSAVDLTFTARYNGVIDQVAEDLDQTRSSQTGRAPDLSASDIRLKAALLMLDDLSHLDSPNLDPALRYKNLQNILETLLSFRCNSMTRGKKFRQKTSDMVKLFSLIKPRVSELNNRWVNVALICQTKDEITAEMLAQKYAELRHVSLQHVVVVHPTQQELDAMIGSDQSMTLLEPQIESSGLTRDPESSRLIGQYYHDLMGTEQNIVHLRPEESLSILMELEIFFDKWKLYDNARALGELRHLAAIGWTSCTSSELRRRDQLEHEFEQPNLRHFVAFYNHLLKHFCLDSSQHELDRKSVGLKDPALFRGLVNLGLVAALTPDRYGIDYRLRATAGYLLRYRSLRSDGLLQLDNLGHIFEQDIRKPCEIILQTLDPDLRAINLVLDVSDASTRHTFVSKSNKYLMFGAKLCRYLASPSFNIQELMDTITKFGDNLGPPWLEIISRSLDITDEALYFEPELAKPIGPEDIAGPSQPSPGASSSAVPLD